VQQDQGDAPITNIRYRCNARHADSYGVEQRERRQTMELKHHSFIKEFCEYRGLIHALKVEAPDFRSMFDEYYEIDKEVCCIERDI
jgi:hypothetical protein